MVVYFSLSQKQFVNANAMAGKIFSIIGDANVRRNMTSLNIGSREVMKSAQVIDFASSLDQAFQQVRTESNVCIVTCITDVLLANGFCGTVYASIDQALTSFFTSISGYSVAHPALQACAHFSPSFLAQQFL